MSRRQAVGLGSAATVVLAGVSGALINELHGGWGWFVAAGGVVLVAAMLTGWLAMRPDENAGNGDHLGSGAVKAGRDIEGPVRTTTRGARQPDSGDGVQSGDRLAPGSVKAGRDIRGGVTTRTTIDSDSPDTPPADRA